MVHAPFPAPAVRSNPPAGAISALQFQAVRLACARHELRLPDGARAGFFLGDGEGCLRELGVYAGNCIEQLL
jgi:hypothetical protein